MNEPLEVATKQIRVFPSDWEILERERKLIGERATMADVIKVWRGILAK